MSKYIHNIEENEKRRKEIARTKTNKMHQQNRKSGFESKKGLVIEILKHAPTHTRTPIENQISEYSEVNF